MTKLDEKTIFVFHIFIGSDSSIVSAFHLISFLKKCEIIKSLNSWSVCGSSVYA